MYLWGKLEERLNDECVHSIDEYDGCWESAGYLI